MKQLPDHALAARMLQGRADHGYKFAPFIRMNAKGYGILIGLFAIPLVGFTLLDRWNLFLFTLGVLLGALSRDIGWLQGTNRTWPFIVKVTDWEAVKKLSEEKPST